MSQWGPIINAYSLIEDTAIALLATVTSFTSSVEDDSAGTLGGSHTTDAGTDMLVVVACTGSDDNDVEDISGITFDSVALTKIDGFEVANSERRMEVWVLAAPAIGAKTLTATYASAGTSDSRSLTALNYKNVGSAVIADFAGGTGTGQGATVTTDVNDSMIVGGGMSMGGDSDPFTPDSGVTEITEGDTGADTGLLDHAFWIGERLTTTAGAYNFGTTSSVSAGWMVMAIELKP